MLKNRPKTGENHPNAKLTDLEVELMRQLYEAKVGYRRLAAKFQVSRTAVRKIVHYEMR